MYNLAGQKYDPPEEVCTSLLHNWFSISLYSWWTHHHSSFVWYEQREPLRIFYESLSKQIPTSEMAEFWCGLFSDTLLNIHCLFNPFRIHKPWIWNWASFRHTWPLGWQLSVLGPFNGSAVSLVRQNTSDTCEVRRCLSSTWYAITIVAKFEL